MPDFSTMAQMMQNTANPQPRGLPIMRGVAAPAPAGAAMPPPGMAGMTSGPTMGEMPAPDPMSQVMQQIIQLFQQQTGRAPTQEEMQAILSQVAGGGGQQQMPPMPSQGPMPGQMPGGQPPIPPNTNASTMRR